MKELVLNTSVKSIIHCGEGAFRKFAPKFGDGQSFIVTDDNVYGLYEDLIKNTFPSSAKIIIPAGEESKNPQTLLNVLRAMLENNLRRNCTVIALGGGVVGDIAGLAASLYMRGVRLVQIPTTLLAQVDSSVGGKTAVDMCGVKNVIGTFYQPEEVIIDSLFLKTLPAREINCGLGEIIKYGALDGGIYEKLVNASDLKDLSFLGNITYDCVAYKAKVVAEDERETTGARKALNLGHTTGHALELTYGEKSHGEYVLIGAYYELYIARNFGICGGQYADSLEKLILSVLGKVLRYDGIKKAAEAALHDKKNDDENISLIVPASKGKYLELKVAFADYCRLLEECSENIGGRK